MADTLNGISTVRHEATTQRLDRLDNQYDSLTSDVNDLRERMAATIKQVEVLVKVNYSLVAIIATNIVAAYFVLLNNP